MVISVDIYSERPINLRTRCINGSFDSSYGLSLDGISRIYIINRHVVIIKEQSDHCHCYCQWNEVSSGV
jgi:hypothetical protein